LSGLIIDSISYKTRHDNNEVCYAIFDRSHSFIEIDRRERDLDVEWVYDLMEIYGVGIAPDTD
jgi:hypothetical protein